MKANSFVKAFFAPVAFAVLLASAPAGAQAPSPAQNPPQPAPAQPGVALQVAPPTAKHVALARELMEHIGAARLFESILPNMSRQISTLVGRTRPDLATDLKAAIESVEPEFEKQKVQLLDSAVAIFTRSMTEQELAETTGFLRSASGQKFLDTQGQTINAIAVMLEQWNRQLSVDMLARVRAEMKKKGHDI